MVVPGLVTVMVAVCVNAALNYILIWGVGGWGGLGFKGSPIATSLSSYVLLFTLLAYLWLSGVHRSACPLQPWTSATFTRERVRGVMGARPSRPRAEPHPPPSPVVVFLSWEGNGVGGWEGGGGGVGGVRCTAACCFRCEAGCAA